MVWPLFKKQQQTLKTRECHLYDLHSHIVWGLDDGARTLDDTVSYLRKYALLGFHGVIATPHTNHRLFSTPSPEEVLKKLEMISGQMEETGVAVKSGSEVMCVGEYAQGIEQGEYPAVGNTFLVEFENRPGSFSSAFERVLFKMRVAEKTLILAHPERYTAVHERPELPGLLKAHGMLMQINLGSLVGGYGERARELAWQFVEEGIADFASTDLHRLKDFDAISLALEELERFDVHRFETLVSVNPRQVFEGKPECIGEV